MPRNPLAQLLPQTYQNPSPLKNPFDNSPNPMDDLITGGPQPQQSPLMALAGSQDATGGSSSYDTPILRKYKAFLDQAPNPEDYKPSKTRKIIAMLAGMGAGAGPASTGLGGQPLGFRFDPSAAIGTQQEILGGPLARANKSYDTRAKTLEQAAGIEERDIANQGRIKASEELDKSRDEANRIKDENAKTAALKNQQEFQVAQQKLQEKVDEAAKRAEEWQKKYEADQTNHEALNKLSQARIDMMNTQHELQKAQNEYKMAETERLHNAQIEKMKADVEAAKERARIAEEAANAKVHPPDTEVSKKDTYEGGFDLPLIGHVGGKKVGSTTTTTRGNYQAMPGQQPAQGKVLVKRKSDGQIGLVTNPDPKLYDKVNQ